MTELLILAFISCFGLILSAGLLLNRRDTNSDRIEEIVAQQDASRSAILQDQQPRQTLVASVVKPFQNLLPRTSAEVSVQQKRLIRAGYRAAGTVNIFYGFKVLVPLTLAAIVTVTGIYQWGPFFMYAVCLGVGFLLPDFWLGRRIQARKRKIRLGLPEALDLMVICSEAGLGIDQTIYKVSLEMVLSQPEIHDEFSLVNLEQRAGRARADALRGMADRVDLDSVRALINTLIQADTFGTSISKTLRVYSETLRTQRRQKAEEQAAKTTVKLVFPLVLFIFPAIFVVALGPAMIAMYEGFVKYLLQ